MKKIFFGIAFVCLMLFTGCNENAEAKQQELLIKQEALHTLKTEKRFPNNTNITINNWTLNVSGQTTDAVYEQYVNSKEKTFFNIVINDKNQNIELTDCYEHSIKLEHLNNLIEGITFDNYLENKEYNFELKDTLILNKEKVKENIICFVDNLEYNFTSAQDSYFNLSDYTIVPEVYGTELDKDKCVNKIQKSILNGDTSVSLDDEQLYIQPSVLVGEITEKFQDIIDVYNWKATYPFVDYEIEMKNYMNYVGLDIDTGEVTIDTSFFKNAVLGLSKIVDENGKARTFKTTLDGEIKLSGGTYGQIMNNNEEIKYLIEKLEKRENVLDRIPIWKQAPKEEGYENTYIEIDLSAQHVWYYENNQLVMESDCVTGTDKTSRATPTGFYFVSEKINGKYLIGADYKTWVDKWMRITNQGHGLHDAQWRKASEFGGNTYKTDGSHGCINLPKQFAYDLYDAIKTGVLVVIHE